MCDEVLNDEVVNNIWYSRHKSQNICEAKRWGKLRGVLIKNLIYYYITIIDNNLKKQIYEFNYKQILGCVAQRLAEDEEEYLQAKMKRKKSRSSKEKKAKKESSQKTSSSNSQNGVSQNGVSQNGVPQSTKSSVVQGQSVLQTPAEERVSSSKRGSVDNRNNDRNTASNSGGGGTGHAANSRGGEYYKFRNERDQMIRNPEPGNCNSKFKLTTVIKSFYVLP
jgi:hypothetical protein